MTPDDAPIPADPLSGFVREHAALALEGLLPIEQAAASVLADALPVETVHTVRTSLRRLRAVLRTFPESFPCAAAADHPADRDLRFVARTFSELRDTDVLTEGLLAQVQELPASLVLGPVREELAGALAQRRREAVAHVAARHGTPPWHRSLDLLRSWAEEPPRLREQETLPLLARLREEVRHGLHTAGEDPAALHAVRRRAKRWRYAAEMLRDREPGAAEQYEAASTVHLRLGLLQDSVVAAQFLLERAATGPSHGRGAFTLGVLHQRAQQRIEHIVAEAPRLL